MKYLQVMRHLLTILALFCLWVPVPAVAGGSPETTLLVVNSDSPLSLTVANTYIRLREIPENHVVWVHDIPSIGKISMKTFRERIWAPIRSYMDEQGLAEVTDTIVYAADFPYAVDLRQELKRHQIRPHKYIGRYASLTGLTFFARQVENSRIDYLSRYSNHYYRRDLSSKAKFVENMKKEDERQLTRSSKALQKNEYQIAHEQLLSLNAKYPARAMILIPLAETQAGLEQRTQAISTLKQLQALGFSNSLILRNSKHLKRLSDDADFMQILQQMDTPSSRFEKPHGFRSQYHWSRHTLTNSAIDRYYLSAILAYTGQRGNSLAEIRDYLGRSKASDGGFPDGTVYLMENGDIRAEARQPWFSDTCALLKQIDRRCSILSRGAGSRKGLLPENRKDIIGLAAGTRGFRWKGSNNKLLPGAIADSFTSYGGDFDRKQQTKLTEFLRQGASGSSGAVTEPYAIPEKFPLPLMHFYYARGCSLAESWYQAVASPYQAILAGDPLTRPYADFSSPQMTFPDSHRSWQGEVSIRTVFTGKSKHNIKRLELWVDGLPVSETAPDMPLIWNTETASDGCHDLRLVAIDGSPIETRSYTRYRVCVANKTFDFEVNVKNDEPDFYETVEITGKTMDAELIKVYQGTRVLGRTKVENGRWEVRIAAEKLGLGKILLSVAATAADGDQRYKKEVWLDIKPSPNRPAVNKNNPEKPGLLVALKYKNRGIEYKNIKNLNGRYNKLIEKKAHLQDVRIEGQFLVNSSGFQQMTIHTQGLISISIDGQSYHKKAPDKEYGMVYLPLFLEKGWHNIAIQPSPGGFEKLTVLLSGEQAPMILSGK